MNKAVNKSNNSTVELLSEMHRNVTMGMENLAMITPKIHDRALISNVTNQLERYSEFSRETEKHLERNNIEAKSPSLMKKAMSWGGIEFNTLVDSSDKHLAEMIEKGTRMGADQLEEKKSELISRGINPETIELCSRITEFEREECAKMKKFM